MSLGPYEIVFVRSCFCIRSTHLTALGPRGFRAFFLMASILKNWRGIWRFFLQIFLALAAFCSFEQQAFELWRYLGLALAVRL